MNHRDSIGLFFYNLPLAVADSIAYAELAQFAQGFAQVAGTWQYNEFAWNEETIVKKIKAHDLTRIIIAGGLPGSVKGLFSKAMTMAGRDPGSVTLSSFYQYGIRAYSDMERARALLLCAIKNIPYEVAVVPETNEVNPSTLIIGAGIAGIQAALEIAGSNNLVYLVEKSGTIGGKMATFDKTFPTLDCAACILTPKMVEVNQHPKIRLMTYCEVTEVTGQAGNYTVRIHQKARKVNVTTCIGCGTCAEKCPALAPSEFDAGTAMRKAIYIPFPQAVPNKYLVDAESCIYLKNGKCKACVKACPVPDCINLDEPDSEVTLNVGNIIVATGYQTFDAKKMEQYGYGKYPNVLTALEFERLLNASGPTGGNIHFRIQDKKGNWVFNTEAGKPEKLAIIHCVGSRDKNYNKYCSRVCCMYSLKFAHLILDKLDEAEVFEYFIDMRSFGKGYEEFYERIKEEGVWIIRGKTAKVEEKDGKLLIRGEDILRSTLIENSVDMVILSTGLEPGEDTAILSKMLGIPTTECGWFEEANYHTDPTGTFRGGIMLAGTCQGPKDIPDTVAQGSAAAARAIQNIIRNNISRDISDMSLQEIENRINDLSPVY
jgi:heterodisulfide reductase subunit A